MPQIDLRPRKSPRQARSADTVETILAAATRVLECDSLAGFNTNRVAEVAGVSVGSLYQYFPNKSALIAALIDRQQSALAQSIEACVAAYEGRSLREALFALADLGVEQQYQRPLLSAALDQEETRLPLDKRLRESEQRIGAAVMSLLCRHEKELAISPKPSDVQDIFVIAKALIEADAMAGRPPPPDLRDRVVRALWGYLTARIPQN
ncbi:MAG: TetR/AcrR family transcriptional regulator [Betaproteobacteria bacterium]|jgi:AcrR family transcriptional regulator|nr:TetR/AcrR family transcriptional regulator [Betaproteobacteria bacterium]